MKKLAAALCVVLVAFAFSAWAGTPTPGKYQGTQTSVVTDQNNKTITAEVKTEGGKTIATVTYPDAKEIWTWDGTKLLQQELDATGKVASSYAANNTNGKYMINCADAAKGVCDMQLDPRAYWTLSNTDNSFTYTYFNIAKNQKLDPNMKDDKRTQIVFNLAK